MKHLIFVVLCAIIVGALPVYAADTIRAIQFPIAGPATYGNDFNLDANAGRVHQGIDMMSPKMTPVVAAVDGRVAWFTETEASFGWMIRIEDSDGYSYHYIHLNNDTPGTDDGVGGRQYAIAPEIYRGASVTKGQVIGWVGDSGNAETIASHLHFEIQDPSRNPINPYLSLLGAEHPGRYVPSEVLSASPTINADRGLTEVSTAPCVSHSLIRSTSAPAVYYCGANGKRYVFPNEKTYLSWYKNFSGVTTITDAQMAQVPIGGNVTYRPGVKLVKIQTDPKVYAVAPNGTLRWVTSTAIAVVLYGSTWAKQVDDIPETFFINYKVGDPITSAD